MIDTVAGGAIPTGVPANTLELHGPSVTGDGQGTLYFTDGNVIRRLRSDGVVETIAGNGIGASRGDGGPAAAATLLSPYSIVLDQSGNLFFFDGAASIRRIDTLGKISTVAGTGISGSLGADGPATSAQIDALSFSAALGPDGSLFFIELDVSPDRFVSRVRKLTPDGRLVLVAGGTKSPDDPGTGDGGPATSAALNQPSVLTFDSQGNLFIAELGRIRRIGLDGTISTFAGNGVSITSGDGGPAKSAGFDPITGLAVDSQDSLYISECASNGRGCRLRRIGRDGIINLVAGGGPATSSGIDGPALSVRLLSSSGLFIDAQGYVYFSDSTRIRRLTPAMTIETIAGASPASAQDGPDARKAWFLNPAALAADQNNNLYIAERCQIRMVAPDGTLSTVAGKNPCRFPISLPPTTDLPLLYRLAVTRQGLIYASDEFGHLFSIATDRTITQLPGFGSTTTGVVSPPLYVAVDSQDRLYIAEGFGAQVLRLKQDGTTEVFADLRPAFIGAPSAFIGALTVDPLDNVWVASEENAVGIAYRVTQDRKVTRQQFSPFPPTSIAVDSTGAVYGTDASRLRGFSSGGALNRFVFGLNGDGGPLVSAGIAYASSLIRAPSGDFYFIDSERVRRITGLPPATPPSFSAAGVVNAGSGLASAISQGELISIYGTNLGTAPVAVTVPAGNFFPDAAGSTQVVFDGYLAPVLFATSNQINVFVPHFIASQPRTSIQVEVDGILSTPVSLTVAKSAFGLFTANGSGSGQGAILNQDGSINRPSHPAARGSVVVLYGTGEGQTTPPLPDGALMLSTPYSTPNGVVTVNIGGKQAEVLYAGAAPFLPTGILQINARVPSTISPGDAPIMVSIDGISTTRQVTVAVQ